MVGINSWNEMQTTRKLLPWSVWKEFHWRFRCKDYASEACQSAPVLTFCFRRDLRHHDDLHPGLRPLPTQPGVQLAQQLGHHRPQEEQQGAGDRGRPVWYRRPQRGRLSKSDEWAGYQGQRHLADGFAPSTKGLYNAWNNTVEQYKRPSFKRLAFQKILRSFVWEDAETVGRTRPYLEQYSKLHRESRHFDLSGQGWDLCGQKLSLRACRTKCQLAKVSLAATVCDTT